MKQLFISMLSSKSTQSFFITGVLGVCLTFGQQAQAQETENVKIKNTTIEYQIDKNTQDIDLEQIKQEVNDEKIATLNFSNIKRNDKGEIIAISTQFKDERGSSQQKTEYNSMGINPFSVVIHERENGEKYLEISNSVKNNLAQNNPYANFTMQQSLFDDDDSSTEDFFSQDFMQLMKTMQEDMQEQQETFIQMMQQAIQDKNTND